LVLKLRSSSIFVKKLLPTVTNPGSVLSLEGQESRKQTCLEDVMNRILAFPLALVLILMPLGPLAMAQEVPTRTTVTKLKDEIVRRISSGRSNVTIKLRNGSELKGRITQTQGEWFTLKEDKTKYHRDLNYADVVNVRGRGLSKGAKFGILTAIVAGAVVIGALISLKHLDPFEHGVLR